MTAGRRGAAVAEGGRIIDAMSDREKPAAAPAPFDPMQTKRPQPIRSTVAPSDRCEPKTLCDRCGAEVYRMHAVWRCPQCGFKSDCCGW